MKVNVTGKGYIPGFNSLAPVYNKDADKAMVKRLLAFRNFRVYRAEDPVLITMKNIDEVFANNAKATAISTEPVIASTATHAPITKPVVIEKKVVEATAPVVEEKQKEEEVVEPVVEETVPEEVVVESVTEDAAVDEEIVAEEAEVTDEEVVESIKEVLVDEVKEELTTSSTGAAEIRYPSKKKNKRNHH